MALTHLLMQSCLRAGALRADLLELTQTVKAQQAAQAGAEATTRRVVLAQWGKAITAEPARPMEAAQAAGRVRWASRLLCLATQEQLAGLVLPHQLPARQSFAVVAVRALVQARQARAEMAAAETKVRRAPLIRAGAAAEHRATWGPQVLRAVRA